MATNPHNDPLADDDPTNELPVLHPDAAELAGSVEQAELDRPSHIPVLTVEADAAEGIAELDLEQGHLDEEIEALRAEIAARTDGQAALRAALAERDTAIAELTAKLEEARARLHDTQTERQRLADDITAREAEIHALRRQGPNAALAAELAAAREQISTLDHYVANRAAHWTALEAELATERDRVKELETELAQRAQRTAQAQNRERRAETQAAELRQRLIAESDAARARERGVEELTNRLDETATQHGEAIERIATLEAEILQWRELSDKLRSELAGQTRDVQERSQAAERETRRVAKLEKQLAGRDKKIEKLEADLAAGAAAGEELQNRNAQLEEALADERTTNSATAEQRAARLAELEGSLASLEQYQRDNESLAARLQETVQQHESLSDKASTLADELDARNAVVAHLESQVELLREAEAARDNAVTAAETRIQELTARLENQEHELEQARAALATSTADLEQAQEATAASSLQHADHLERIGHLEEQLETSLELNEELTRMQETTDRYKKEAEAAREARSELDETLSAQQQSLEELRREIATSETRRQEQDLLIGELRRQLRDKDHQLARTRPRGGAARSKFERTIHQIENAAAPRSGAPRTAERAPTRLLVCVSGDQEVRYPLYKDVLSIGRTSENDIQIRTHYVSRKHARVVVRHDQVFVEDLKSKNGVYLNSLRVSSGQLKSGDRLTIGETEFRFLVAPSRNT